MFKYVDLGGYELAIYNGIETLEIIDQNAWSSVECGTTIFHDHSTGTVVLRRLARMSHLAYKGLPSRQFWVRDRIQAGTVTAETMLIPYPT